MPPLLLRGRWRPQHGKLRRNGWARNSNRPLNAQQASSARAAENQPRYRCSARTQSRGVTRPPGATTHRAEIECRRETAPRWPRPCADRPPPSCNAGCSDRGTSRVSTAKNREKCLRESSSDKSRSRAGCRNHPNLCTSVPGARRLKKKPSSSRQKTA